MNFNIYRHLEKIDALSAGSVVAIGNFDGVHKGHQAVLSKAEEKAKKLNVPFVVLTFEPHPKRVLGLPNAPERITPFAAKCRVFKKFNVNAVYAVRFTKSYAKTTAVEFVENTLKNTLNAKHVVIGDDFAFGKGREGSIEMITKLGKNNGFEVAVIPQVTCENGEDISSTRIRAELAKGNIQAANKLMAHPFTIVAHFVEDQNLNLVAPIKHYTTIKNAVYFVQIEYNNKLDGIGEDGDHPAIMPMAVKNGKIFIPPTEIRPGTPKHSVTLKFREQIEQ